MGFYSCRTSFPAIANLTPLGTDFWEAYQGILPIKRPQPIGKETGRTNHIERFKNTLRQQVGRLVRKSLSFSKKFQNHLGAIWDFIHYYNASLQY